MRPLKIVIADDEAVIRMDLREMLEDAGHTVSGEASNGRMAVSLTRRHRPDLVIMDVKMPVMDGISAAKLISDLAPVLLLTAFSDSETVESARDSGVLAYLVKPVREENLFPAMEIALSGWERMKSLEAELCDARESLETRKLIDRAKGIIMDAHGIGEAEAYRKMQRYSMTKRKTLKEVAQSVIKAAASKKHAN